MRSLSPYFLAIFIVCCLSLITDALTPQNAPNVYLAQQKHQQVFLSHKVLTSDNTTASFSSPEHDGRVSSLKKNHFTRRQAAAGGVILIATPPSQYPTVTYAGSLFTVGSATSVIWKDFTQTFATTALGTWAFGPTPKIGTIGLGTIQGTVGITKNGHKRAIQTPNLHP